MSPLPGHPTQWTSRPLFCLYDLNVLSSSCLVSALWYPPRSGAGSTLSTVGLSALYKGPGRRRSSGRSWTLRSGRTGSRCGEGCFPDFGKQNAGPVRVPGQCRATCWQACCLLRRTKEWLPPALGGPGPRGQCLRIRACPPRIPGRGRRRVATRFLSGFSGPQQREALGHGGRGEGGRSLPWDLPGG